MHEVEVAVGAVSTGVCVLCKRRAAQEEDNWLFSQWPLQLVALQLSQADSNIKPRSGKLHCAVTDRHTRDNLKQQLL